MVEASGHDASLASVFEYAAQDGRVSMVGLNIGRKIPVANGLAADEEPDGPRLHRLARRLAGGDPLPGTHRHRSSPIQTHDFGLTDAVEAFKLGQDPQACIKVTLSTKGLN